MKKDWTYKKLGEVCETTSGGTPSKSKMEYYENGDIPWLRSGELSNGEIYSTELCITQKGLDNSSAKIIPAGTVSIAMYGATVGEVGIIKKPMCTNQAICNILPNEQFIPNFIRYVLVAYKPKFISLATGGAQPNISQNIIKNTSIPIPPLAIQRSIVSELDLLHSVISKKKEQLRELDNLAQSLFYQMFGDPITNPMGWEIKKLGEVGTFCRGGGFLKSDYVESGFPCIHYGQIHMKFGAFATKHLTEIPKSLVKEQRVAKHGDVIIAITSEDLEGSCKSIAWLGNYDVAVGAHAAIFSHNQDAMYISYYTKTQAFYNEKQRYARGFKVMEIRPDDIARISLPLPPLSLQQSFAARVSAIEAQKQAVQQSIREIEALLAERMDNYFG